MIKVSNQQLEEIVKAYQKGDDKAAELLLRAYQAYFQKFVNLIKYGNYSVYDKHVVHRFLGCFMSEEERANLKLVRKSPFIQQKIHEKAEWIRYALNFMEEDELRSELTVILFSMADHHHKHSFSTYVSGFLPLTLARRLMSVLSDESEYHQYNIGLTDNIIEASCEDEYDLDEEQPKYYILSAEPTLYDENWINGTDCGAVFEGLSPQERRIVKLYYEWKTIGLIDRSEPNKPVREIELALYQETKARLKRTEQEIADLLGCSRKTVNLKRKQIREKIEELATDLRLIKG